MSLSQGPRLFSVLSFHSRLSQQQSVPQKTRMRHSLMVYYIEDCATVRLALQSRHAVFWRRTHTLTPGFHAQSSSGKCRHTSSDEQGSTPRCSLGRYSSNLGRTPMPSLYPCRCRPFLCRLCGTACQASFERTFAECVIVIFFPTPVRCCS